MPKTDALKTGSLDEQRRFLINGIRYAGICPLCRTSLYNFVLSNSDFIYTVGSFSSNYQNHKRYNDIKFNAYISTSAKD